MELKGNGICVTGQGQKGTAVCFNKKQGGIKQKDPAKINSLSLPQFF